ncbi:hypothetical protein VDGD_20802 [Verticillium dahliae]|nr:hypothetical protein VDGD_20802 [Verticillium dahliae]
MLGVEVENLDLVDGRLFAFWKGVLASAAAAAVAVMAGCFGVLSACASLALFVLQFFVFLVIVFGFGQIIVLVFFVRIEAVMGHGRSFALGGLGPALMLVAASSGRGNGSPSARKLGDG